MNLFNNRVNLVLSGGGVKGIAYIGAFGVAERIGYKWGNIAGVSAGALAGSFAAAGYSTEELKNIMNEFDMQQLEINEIPGKVSAVSRYMRFANEYRSTGAGSLLHFLCKGQAEIRDRSRTAELSSYRGNILKNAVTYSKEGCLYDGDYLEEWVDKVLAGRGIQTFGDLRGGMADKANPNGYKVRMTAVDATRAKTVVLPDDIAFYGINPDGLRVSKAVRMSTSVPFAFKPVELKKQEQGVSQTFHIVDGGVFDNFPFWLIDNSEEIQTAGFRLDGGGISNIISFDTPLNILKGLISAVHDLGIPKDVYFKGVVANIDTSMVSFLDFNLTDAEKKYLYSSGEKSAIMLFSNIRQRKSLLRKLIMTSFFKR